jgi:cystathionine beta-lyase
MNRKIDDVMTVRMQSVYAYEYSIYGEPKDESSGVPKWDYDKGIIIIPESLTIGDGGVERDDVRIIYAQNEELREPFLKQLRDAKLDEAPIASLVATIAAYNEGTPWLQSLKEYLQGNIREVVDFFSTNDLGIKAIQPQASFLVWLDCRAMGLGQDELMRFFSDKGLLLSNGAAYGQGGEGFVRMNIGCPRKIVKEALGRILRASSGLE